MKSIIVLDDGKSITEKEVSAFNDYDGIRAFFRNIEKHNTYKGIKTPTVIIMDMNRNVLGMCHKANGKFYYCVGVI